MYMLSRKKQTVNILNKSYFSFSIPHTALFFSSLPLIHFLINGPMGGCVSQASCHAVFWTQTCADGSWTAVSSSHPGSDEIWLVQSQVSPASQRLTITFHKQAEPKRCQMLECILTIAILQSMWKWGRNKLHWFLFLQNSDSYWLLKLTLSVFIKFKFWH